MLHPAVAQQHTASPGHESENHKEEHGHIHRLVLFTGYGIIPGAINEDKEKQVKVIPVMGVDYEFWFNHKFGLALINDLELASYVVEKDHEEYIDRNYAFVTSLVFLWEPVRNWALFAGPGYEFEAHHSFPLFKIGTDISKSFEDGWSVGLAMSYDIKEVNSSLSLGITVAKKLGK